MSERLRPLWDFGDLDESERRFRARLDDEPDNAGRAEVLTQLARVEGLRGSFDVADKLLDEAAELAQSERVVGAVIDLERGRVRRSSGDKDAAYPLFVSAFEVARSAGQTFLAADAAHMAALAAPDRDGFVAWTERGLATGDPYWPGSLLNNLGWEYFDAGDHAEALGAFERALEARQRFPERPAEIAIARYAVAKALLGLGRSREAADTLEQAVAWTEQVGKPDGWFHEELAAAYADLDDERAAEQARLALPLLERDDPSFEGERADRLRALAEPAGSVLGGDGLSVAGGD